MSSPFDAVTTYFLAKDGNRPFLMRRAFAEGVELQMVVKTDAISFPQSATGVAAIEDILGRRFANDFDQPLDRELKLSIAQILFEGNSGHKVTRRFGGFEHIPQ